MDVADRISDCLAVVLAAGDGKRMRSDRPKVLHEVAGRSMLAHVVAAIEEAGIARLGIVVGPGRDDVAAVVPQARPFVQHERHGTAHAVLASAPLIAEGCRAVIVAFADNPLLRPQTFAALWRGLHDSDAAVAVLGFEAADPTGYGRLIMNGFTLEAIREERDASEVERGVTLCNGGIMAIDGAIALDLLKAVKSDNAQNEFYLTDVVRLARERGRAAIVVTVDEREVIGVNDRVQLAKAEAAMQHRLRETAMRRGATLIDPDSVTFSFDTVLEPDTVVEPHVVFASNVQVGEGARIRSFSHLEGVKVGRRAVIGPFARLRPGTQLAEGVHVGNFVEVKASSLGKGVKASHLSYIGDATVGDNTNIGAGTITCNYDGFAKARTTLGKGVFVGSHSSLVAPVTVGAGAYIGTGSVVTEDVAPDALVIARVRQFQKPGWARDFRAKKAAEKARS